MSNARSTPEFASARIVDALFNLLVSNYGVNERDLSAVRELCHPKEGHPDGFIALESLAEVCNSAVSLVDDPWLGFKLGYALPPAHIGAVGIAASTCDNVEEALVFMRRYSDTLLSVPTRFRKGEAHAIYAFDLPALFNRQKQFTCQILVATTLRFLKDCVGYLPRDLSLDFPFPEIAGDGIGLPENIHFDADCTTIAIPEGYLRAPLLSSDPVMCSTIQQACESIAAQLDSSKSLGSFIKQILAASQNQYPTMENVADMLHVTPRTLRNRLAREKLSYRSIINESRLEKAKALLDETALTVDEIAERLGYGATGNFSRAFKRDVGVSPSVYRALEGAS